MNKFFYIMLLCSLPLSISAQFDSLGLKTKWSKGFIVLEDDSRLNGLIQHNAKLGLVKFKTGAESAEHSFLERNINRFEYFDTELSKARKFSRFGIVDSPLTETRNRDEIFEVIMEFPDFALLSKSYAVNPAVRNYNDGFGGTTPGMIGYEQYEKIFLVSESGVAETLLEIIQVERRNQKKKPAKVAGFYDKRLLQTYIGPKWPDVEAYIKENRLVLNQKGDMLQVFEYYASIL